MTEEKNEHEEVKHDHKEEHEEKKKEEHETKDEDHKKHKKEEKKHKKKKTKKYLKPIIGVIVVIAVIAIIIIAANYPKLTEKSQGNAALVNDEPISMKTLNKEYELFFQLTGYPEEYREVITTETFLEQLILEKLLIQEAKKQDLLVVSKKEVDSAFSNYMYNLPLSEVEFELNLESKNLELNDVRNYFKKQIVLVSFLNKTILTMTEVSDEDVEAYYNENEELFKAGEGQIRASHILIETEEEAEEIIEQLKKGADFAELAKERSADPSAQTNSGSLGFFGEGQMVAEFEEATFALKINEVSEPVETSFGFHVIKRQSETITLDETREQIKQTLLLTKQQDTITDYLEDLKDKAKIKIYSKAIQPTGAAVSEPEVSAETSECIGKHDITPDTVIFYYSNGCGWCAKMKPGVTQLQEEGYDFYWAEAGDAESTQVIEECFRKYITSGGVPQFICAKNADINVGAFTDENLELDIETLREFADKCKG